LEIYPCPNPSTYRTPATSRRPKIRGFLPSKPTEGGGDERAVYRVLVRVNSYRSVWTVPVVDRMNPNLEADEPTCVNVPGLTESYRGREHAATDTPTTE